MLDKITALIGIEQIDHIVPKARKRLMHGWKTFMVFQAT